MKISKKVADAMIQQMKGEFDNAFIYLSMASWCEENNLPGFAKWNFVQFQEEQTHGIKFYNYLIERFAHAEILNVDKPQASWTSPLNLFEDILKREEETTKAIYNLYKIAQEENDYTSLGFLQWYLDEQIEEESDAAAIVEKLKMIGDSKSGLLVLDRELAQRVFVDSTK